MVFINALEFYMAQHLNGPRASITSRVSHDVKIPLQTPSPERLLNTPQAMPSAVRDDNTIHPDELFAKNTISEVRGMQWRLRYDLVLY